MMFDKNKFEYFLWNGTVKFVKLIGYKRIPAFSRLISTIFFYFIPIRKKTVINNLSKAFPELSQSEIKKLARGNYYSFAITFLEIMAFSWMSREEILSLVDCDGVDLILEKEKEGNGVILLTAHLANWELGAIYIGLATNRQIHVLAKKQRNKYVYEWLKQLRERFGNREILMGASVRELYKTLLEGGMIGMVGDQRGPEESVRVNIFGQPTATFSGTAALAIKNQVPIITVLAIRQKNNKYKMTIDEISFDNLPDDNPGKIKELNQRYMNQLENQIRKAPEQWFWMHQIWKY